MLRAGLVSLDLAYIWDSLVTWMVRGRGDVKELNPLISTLSEIHVIFYACFRLGVLLLLNVLIWEVWVEDPAGRRSWWLRGIVLLGLLLYAIPLQMSLRLLL